MSIRCSTEPDTGYAVFPSWTRLPVSWNEIAGLAWKSRALSVSRNEESTRNPIARCWTIDGNEGWGILQWTPHTSRCLVFDELVDFGSFVSLPGFPTGAEGRELPAHVLHFNERFARTSWRRQKCMCPLAADRRVRVNKGVTANAMIAIAFADQVSRRSAAAFIESVNARIGWRGVDTEALLAVHFEESAMGRFELVNDNPSLAIGLGRLIGSAAYAVFSCPLKGKKDVVSLEIDVVAA